jgi:hypothetical protein
MLGESLAYAMKWSLDKIDMSVISTPILLIFLRRRFFPVEFVYNLLDAMGYLKMNVLHFHLSDYCRFAVESKL